MEARPWDGCEALRRPEANGEGMGTGIFTVAVHPNPGRGGGKGGLALYDPAGKRVFDPGTMAMRSGEGSGRLEVGGLRAGVYVLTAWQGGRVAMARVVVVK